MSQSSLTRAAMTATATDSMVPIFMVKRSSSSLRRLSSELLVTILSRSYSCLACSSVEATADFCKRVMASACCSLKPDDLSSLKNSWVSKVTVAIVVPSWFISFSLTGFYHSVNKPL